MIDKAIQKTEGGYEDLGRKLADVHRWYKTDYARYLSVRGRRCRGGWVGMRRGRSFLLGFPSGSRTCI